MSKQNNTQRNMYFSIPKLGGYFGIVMAIFPFLMTNLFGQDSFFGWNAEAWRTFVLLAFLPSSLAIAIIFLVFSVQDFRAKLSFHLTVMAIASGEFFFSFGSAVNSTEGLAGRREELSIGLFILAIIGFSTFFSLVEDINYHLANVEDITNAFMKGEYNFFVTDKHSLEDKVFGPIVQSLNQAIEITGSLVQNLDTTEEIVQASQELSIVADEISASAEEVASSSQSMSNVANLQAQHVQEIYEKLTELDTAIKNIIAQIQENSEVVSQIALQTNILALNAGIEASRAGDYGRGFAVVAENVRRLSDESKTAAENIISVSDVVAETLQAAFDEIKMKIEEVSALSEETAASSEEVASVSEEMTSSMEELNASANNLAEIAKRIKEYIEQKGLDKLLEQKKKESEH